MTNTYIAVCDRALVYLFFSLFCSVLITVLKMDAHSNGDGRSRITCGGAGMARDGSSWCFTSGSLASKATTFSVINVQGERCRVLLYSAEEYSA